MGMVAPPQGIASAYCRFTLITFASEPQAARAVTSSRYSFHAVMESSRA
jgi:hypothetical protein